ncbi:FAD-binding domain-containing protein [Cryphonectria parasitica EP155]|uniref:Delta(24)-sterol reductase n=1 Tax=Cryphonectria parasitica (strain ATCC 38755 / EP155) TaxID=660469 RepID=A0A9P5CSR6_CRYP1|nr:FAD-binding domain-containing protein [Cryphonectria parasitica EP155]KAF3768636.1 FAD-binding domain-containing protein [Cryphonectria parasitica EP155]
MDDHDATVAKVAARVKEFHKDRKPFRNYHGSSLSTRPSGRNRDNIVDTRALNHVLSVDPAAQTAWVEPNVPMDALVAATMQHGLIPKVVMEFPGITVGGGFSGSAGESSSFRFGLFEATIDEIEIILPTGHVTRASKHDNDKRDLFWGAASAFGTLGIVTLLRVQLMEAKRYVQLTYHVTKGSFDRTLVRLREEMDRQDNDYVDAIMFTKSSTVTCSGRLVEDLPTGEQLRRFTRRKDPWFYLRVEQVHARLQQTRSSSPEGDEDQEEKTMVDYIPLVDYLFRYDRGGFWTGRQAFTYFKVPFNRVTRYLLDPFMYTRIINTAQAKTDFAYHYMVQDCGIPFDRCQEFKTYLDDNVGIYPIWLCPLRVRRNSPDSCHGIHAAMGRPDYPDLLNFGVWGLSSWDGAEALRKNQALEAIIRRLGGWKTLYAHAYYTEEEFWKVYDWEAYHSVREKYGADYLPTVYDKVRVKTTVVPQTDAVGAAAAGKSTSPRTRKRKTQKIKSIWPFRGLIGVYYVLKREDVLLTAKSPSQEAG